LVVGGGRQSFRVVLRNDVVSTLPGPPFYTHGGQEVMLGHFWA
jgi:hypothetical protein